MLDFDPANPDIDKTLAGLDAAIAEYREGYAAYYERCKRDNSPAMRDPNAVVYLIPGVGMITFAKDKATARISGEFYVNAINVMRGASSVSTYVGLPEQEAFDIEYWLLEEAKLAAACRSRKSLAGKRGPRHRRRRRHRQARRQTRLLAEAPASCSPTSTRRHSLNAALHRASPSATATIRCVSRRD